MRSIWLYICVKKYLKSPKFTAEYFPKINKYAKYDKYLPKPNKNPNDWDNNIHKADFSKNYELLYKTDIFAMGRVFYFISKILSENDIMTTPFDLNNLILKMTNENIYMRYNVFLCLNHRYLQNINTSLFKNCCIL